MKMSYSLPRKNCHVKISGFEQSEIYPLSLEGGQQKEDKAYVYGRLDMNQSNNR